MERLQKVMAHAGIASRRKSEEFIRHGEVKVNGKLITEPGYKVDPEQDKILVRGEDISLETKVYILLNKPAGYISTVDDPQNRKTVLDIIPNISQRIYPVGRLDRDSRGLLLLTNDGDLTYKLTHPSHEIQKTYLVEIKDRIKQNKINKLEQGIELEDGLTSPAKAKILKSGDNNSIFTLTISEGRNRQVRRMCKKIGYRVIDLKRIRIGPLSLDEIPEGKYRYLSDKEIKLLKNL